MIQHYLKIAFRNFLKHKTQTVVSVLGLMGGIVCFSVCTYFARDFNRGDKEFPDYNRMVKVFGRAHEKTMGYLYKREQAKPGELKAFLEIDFDEIEYTARYNSGSWYTLEFGNETGKDITYSAITLDINNDFMHVYPSKFLEGSFDSFINIPNSAIISSTLARQISPGESLLGRSFTIRFSRREALEHPRIYTVTGVIEDYPLYTSFSQVPPGVLLKNNDAAENATFLLQKGANTSTINERLEYIKSRNMKEDEDVHLDSYTGVHRISEVKQPLLALIILSFITFLVLLVGVINFISFSIGSFLNRNRELSLRRTLGGNIRHLFFLLFTELGLVVICAVFLSLALCELLIPPVYSLLPAADSMKEILYIDNFRLFSHQIQYGIALLLICALVSLAVSLRTSMQRSLANARRGTKTGSRHRLRNTMLGIQFFICLLFMYATGATILTFIKTYKQYKQLPKDETVVEVPFYYDYMLQENAYEIIDSLRAKEWYESVYYYKRKWLPYERAGKGWYGIEAYYVLPDYFERNNIKTVSGDVHSGDYFCLINRRAQEFLAEDSIYSFVPTMDPKVTYPVTGIVDYEKDERAITFISLGSEKPTDVFVSVKTGADMKQIRSDIMGVIESYLPGGTYYPLTTPDGVIPESALLPFKMVFTFFFVCASICILITVLGLYGAITLDTDRRQKEVAIRKINGAGKRTILWLFGKLYVALYIVSAVVASLIACVIAVAFERLNTFHFSGYQKLLLCLAVLTVAALIILITIIYRLRHIARLNPSECLKTE